MTIPDGDSGALARALVVGCALTMPLWCIVALMAWGLLR